MSAVGGIFAYAMSRATAQGMGVVVIPVWFIFGIGVVSIVTGAFDLARAMRFRLSGQPDPEPVATDWLRKQTNLEGWSY
jgi:hypothetical protein